MLPRALDFVRQDITLLRRKTLHMNAFLVHLGRLHQSQVQLRARYVLLGQTPARDHVPVHATLAHQAHISQMEHAVHALPTRILQGMNLTDA